MPKSTTAVSNLDIEPTAFQLQWRFFNRYTALRSRPHLDLLLDVPQGVGRAHVCIVLDALYVQLHFRVQVQKLLDLLGRDDDDLYDGKGTRGVKG